MILDPNFCQRGAGARYEAIDDIKPIFCWLTGSKFNYLGEVCPSLSNQAFFGHRRPAEGPVI
jgi:hypothetical protein